MKTITIRELHTRTGELLRQASPHREIRVTQNGRVIAKILPETDAPQTPYFARRESSAAFKRLDASGKTGQGK